MAEFWASSLGITVILLAQGLAVIAFVMLSLIFLVYGDRKIWAAVQMRRGPNVVGPLGLLQTFADALKYVLKEIVIPAGADKFVFFLAPFLSMTLALLAFVAIPFAPGWVMADINVGILFIFAVSSLEVYGVIMGGWASNSKYPFLSSLRAAAQMISYEVSLGLIIIGVIISTGSMNISAIVEAQSGAGLLSWYWLPHFPMLVLFFGGWLSPIPGIPDGAIWMFLKMVFWFWMFAMVKAIVPRYRYDQLMRIGWKVFLPLSLGWVVLVAFLARYEVFGSFWARWAGA